MLLCDQSRVEGTQSSDSHSTIQEDPEWPDFSSPTELTGRVDSESQEKVRVTVVVSVTDTGIPTQRYRSCRHPTDGGSRGPPVGAQGRDTGGVVQGHSGHQRSSGRFLRMTSGVTLVPSVRGSASVGGGRESRPWCVPQIKSRPRGTPGRVLRWMVRMEVFIVDVELPVVLQMSFRYSVCFEEP